MNKTFSIFLTLILATTILPACIQCTSENVKASEERLVFRLLAVEATMTAMDTPIPTKSAQYLIRSLLNYSNWNNETDTSHIHLLSRFEQDEVMSEVRQYWTGNSTKDEVHDEIVNYLGSADPNEIAILYYDGYGLDSSLVLDETIYASELTQWFESIPETATVCVIINACYSGSWINDGAGSSFCQDKIVLASCRSDQFSGGWIIRRWSWFTGQETTEYRNGSYLPLGVIGGFVAAKDLNKDGWISFLEDFAFAKPSTEQYSLQESEAWGDEKYLMNPVSYNGLPNGYDPPLIRLKFPVASFTYSPQTIQPNQTVTFNASTSEGTINSYTWDFGDGNITEVDNSVITHIFTNDGNYTVSLNVTDNRGLSNVATEEINVGLLPGDINGDGAVDIYDVVTVSLAFDSEPGDDNWNPIADIAEPYGEVDIYDVVTVTINFGKTS